MKRHIGSIREVLHLHRVLNVRQATRNTLLAYSFLRGRAYRDVERICRTQPNWKEVERMVARYGVLKFDASWYSEQRKAA